MFTIAAKCDDITMNTPLEHNFTKILASFKATLTQDESENFRFATLDDLKQTVVDIQAEQGSARRLQNLRRLDAFLEAMEQYDKVVQTFLNAADLLAFIWVGFEVINMLQLLANRNRVPRNSC